MKFLKICLFCVSLAVVPAAYCAGTDWSFTYCSVVSTGANGSDTLDDTQAFTDAINYCKNNGFKTLFIPAGTYYISSALPALNDSFSFVSVIGENAATTIINGSGLSSGAPIFNSYGGSGGLIGAQIKGLTFTGSGTQTGILLKGSCGISVKNCKFSSLAYGIVLSNDISAGTFTEFCVAEDCDFLTNTALYYVKGAGDASFHGSGLKHCTINNIDGVTEPVIKVGESSNPEIALYNAPMDFQVWTRENINIIKCNVTSNSKIITYGTITLELFDSSAPTLASSNAPVYHAGNVSCWSTPIYFGQMQLVDWAVANPDGSVNVQRKPYHVEKTISTTTTTVSEVAATKQGGLVSVTLSASCYEYNYLLYIVHNGFGSAGYVSIVANPRAFNQAGYGAPTFTVNSTGQLVVTNSQYNGKSISFRAYVMGLGQREYYYLGN